MLTDFLAMRGDISSPRHDDHVLDEPFDVAISHHPHRHGRQQNHQEDTREHNAEVHNEAEKGTRETNAPYDGIKSIYRYQEFNMDPEKSRQTNDGDKKLLSEEELTLESRDNKNDVDVIIDEDGLDPKLSIRLLRGDGDDEDTDNFSGSGDGFSLEDTTELFKRAPDGG